MCKMSTAITEMQQQLRSLADSNKKLTNQNSNLIKQLDKLQSHHMHSTKQRERLTSTPNQQPNSPHVFEDHPPPKHKQHTKYTYSESHQPHHNNRSFHHKPNFNPARGKVLILGDSIPNRLDSHRLSRSVDTPIDLEMQPTIDSAIHRLSKGINEDVKKLVIFTGTNNLKLEPGSVTTEKLLKLENTILDSKHRPSKILIHGILPRSDIKLTPHKRTIVNNALEEMCYRRNWSYISPDYFDHHLLDRGGLHPAGRGKGAIASSLISAIGRGGYPRTPLMYVKEDDFE